MSNENSTKNLQKKNVSHLKNILKENKKRSKIKNCFKLENRMVWNPERMQRGTFFSRIKKSIEAVVVAVDEVAQVIANGNAIDKFVVSRILVIKCNLT